MTPEKWLSLWASIAKGASWSTPWAESRGACPGAALLCPVWPCLVEVIVCLPRPCPSIWKQQYLLCPAPGPRQGHLASGRGSFPRICLYGNQLFPLAWWHSCKDPGALPMHVHSSESHSHQKVERTQVSISKWINRDSALTGQTATQP